MPSTPSDPILRQGEAEAISDLLGQESLDVVYQPIYDLRTGTVFGFEVLTRLSSHTFESTTELFEAAARAGLVGRLGRLQRDRAIRAAPARPLFVNVHPGEFDHPWLIRPDDPIFRHPDDIYLEITESAPLRYFEQCTHVLGELREKGIRVAIDDFGAGFSNVKYISDLAPDVVKLDRELVARVREGSRQFRLVSSVVRLCHDMGAKVVAEGIETVEELVVAEHAGAELCQGYLLGRPDRHPQGEVWPGFS
jgi:EAL domain-containing protein (putative c-di-GMP-specific phosphodiesterase class I)